MTQTTTLPLTAGIWTVDTYHSDVAFSIRHLGISKVRGHFRKFDAQISVGQTLADSVITATVDIASLDTGNSDRDGHTLSPDMLDVANHPTMSYRTTTIANDGDDWTMTGDFTIGDVTREVTFEVEFGGVEESPVDQKRHAGFEANGEIRRSDFGLNFAPGMLGDVIKINLDIQFVEPA